MNHLLKIGSVLAASLAIFLAKPIPLNEFVIHGQAQGTTYMVKYFAKDSLMGKQSIDSVLRVIDTSMSLYKPYSTISQFNLSPTGLALDSHFVKVVQRAVEINKDTQGAFDITVAPLVKYWGFGPENSNKNSATLTELLACVGMDKLELKEGFLAKTKPCVQIDVNGIAQGYTVDVVSQYLQSKGVSSFLVEIGGEIRVNGPKPDGKPMKIGIEGPSDVQGAEPLVQHVVALQTGAITTSGNYRNYLTKGDKRISHLIDPKTGMPLANEMVSVTVYAPDAITADGYDNALMSMHMEQALAFVNNRNDLEAYLIYRKPNGKLADTATAGFKKMMETK